MTAGTAFDRAIAITPQGNGTYAAVSSADWSAPRGAHGGYVAAIVVRAMEAELADPSRPVRSLTLHYARAPQHAPLTIEVAVERSGRNLSTVSARLLQDGQVCVLALAAFSAAFPEVERFTGPMPDVPPAAAIEPWPVRPGVPSIAHRVEFRGAIGALPFSGAAEALTGGWMRMHEPQPLDAAALALYADAWLPAVFSRVHEPVGAPTIDLTIHFRDPAAALDVDPVAAILGVFRSGHASDGFVEEDGELWSPDGTLLVQCRQLALVTAIR